MTDTQYDETEKSVTFYDDQDELVLQELRRHEMATCREHSQVME